MDRKPVSGTAVKAGLSRNRIRYIPEELKKFAPTLKSRPILKDHHYATDNAIGLVTETAFVISDSSVPYVGWIKDEKTSEKIKDRRIKEVSIGGIAGKMVREDDDSDVLIAKDLVALELSTTPTPGVVGTSIRHTLELMERAKTEKVKVKPVFEDINLFESFNMEEKTMTDKSDTEKLREEVKKELLEEQKKVEEAKTLEETKKLEEEQKEKERTEKIRKEVRKELEEEQKKKFEEEVKKVKEAKLREKVKLEETEKLKKKTVIQDKTKGIVGDVVDDKTAVSDSVIGYDTEGMCKGLSIAGQITMMKN